MCIPNTSLGQNGLQLFPDLETRIYEVQLDGSFSIPDLTWISKALGASIRLTVDEEAFGTLRPDHYPWLLQDSVFGSEISEAPSIHLYYSWETSVGDKKHTFGHFDALVPSNPGDEASFFLKADAA